jgi:hypothetical protein
MMTPLLQVFAPGVPGLIFYLRGEAKRSSKGLNQERWAGKEKDGVS